MMTGEWDLWTSGAQHHSMTADLRVTPGLVSSGGKASPADLGTHSHEAQLRAWDHGVPRHSHYHTQLPFSPFIDFWHQKNTDYNNSPFHISQCFVLKLSDLQAVNVGLFDQYFRLTGEWPSLPPRLVLGDDDHLQCVLTPKLWVHYRRRNSLCSEPVPQGGGSCFRNC